MNKQERKQAKNKLKRSNDLYGCLFMILFFVVSVFTARYCWQAFWRNWWADLENVKEVIARNIAAAKDCVKFLDSAGAPQFQNPDELQVKRPHQMYFVEANATRGDVVSIKTSPMTFFIIREVKKNFKAGEINSQPYYLVDVILWPDMVYLAHKEIFADNPTYQKRSKRTSSGYVTVRGEDTTLYRWIAETMRNDPYPLPWEKGW